MQPVVHFLSYIYVAFCEVILCFDIVDWVSQGEFGLRKTFGL